MLLFVATSPLDGREVLQTNRFQPMFTQNDTPIGALLASEKTSQWFTTMIASLQGNHGISISDQTSQDISQLLAKAINGSGSTDGLDSRMHDVSSAYFISRILAVCRGELKSYEAKFNHLTFNYSHLEVLGHTEVADNNEPTLNRLILAEAEINAGNYDKCFTTSTTLVAESDCMSVPSHYVSFQFSKN